MPIITSAVVFSGYVAANSEHIGPPSETPIRTACSLSDDVHHGADVFHPLFERRQLREWDAVREAGAALVEKYQPRKRRQPAQKTPRNEAPSKNTRDARPSPSQKRYPDRPRRSPGKRYLHRRFEHNASRSPPPAAKRPEHPEGPAERPVPARFFTVYRGRSFPRW